MNELVQALIGAGIAPFSAQRIANAMTAPEPTRVFRATGSTPAFELPGSDGSYALYASAPDCEYRVRNKSFGPGQAAFGCDGLAVFSGEVVVAEAAWTTGIVDSRGIRTSGSVTASSAQLAELRVSLAADITKTRAELSVPLTAKRGLQAEGGARLYGDILLAGPLKIDGPVHWGGERRPSPMKVLSSLSFDDVTKKLYIKTSDVAVLNDYGISRVDELPIPPLPGPAVTCKGDCSHIPTICIDKTGFVTSLTHTQIPTASVSLHTATHAFYYLYHATCSLTGSATATVAATTLKYATGVSASLTGSIPITTHSSSNSLTYVTGGSVAAAGTVSATLTGSTTSLEYLTGVTCSLAGGVTASLTSSSTTLTFVSGVTGSLEASSASAQFYPTTDSVTVITGVSFDEDTCSITTTTQELTYLTGGTVSINLDYTELKVSVTKGSAVVLTSASLSSGNDLSVKCGGSSATAAVMVGGNVGVDLDLSGVSLSLSTATAAFLASVTATADTSLLGVTATAAQTTAVVGLAGPYPVDISALSVHCTTSYSSSTCIHAVSATPQTVLIPC